MKNPFRFFRGKSAKPPRSGGSIFHAIRAHFVAAETAAKDTDWWKADYLAADLDASPDTRRILRMRSRYEFQNNSYARGVIQCIANDSIGNGPRLRYASPDDALNTRIERDFTAWAETVRLADKLRSIRITRAQDGEAFAILAINPALREPVKLDISIIDADRVTGGETAALNEDEAAFGKAITVDGISYDRFGNPVSYRVLREHPGGAVRFSDGALVIPAENMLHVFRQDRPEQHRGIPELTAALPLFAKLRRYTNAVVASAEKAAEYGGILYTDHPKDDTAAEIEPMDAVTLDVNQLTTMPEGWKMDELNVKSPIATYPDFKKEMLSEIGAAMGIPYAIVAGTSAGYTYASAKLDHQSYFRTLRTERGFAEDSVLNRVFAMWLREWSLIHPELPPPSDEPDALVSEWNASWLWPMFDNLDMLTAAQVESIALKNKTTTLATEYARQGRNWKTELAQFKREQAYLKKLGIID